jgi:amidohydrolase
MSQEPFGATAVDLRRLELAALAALENASHEAIALRHAIHSDPHVGGDEFATAELIKQALGLPVTDVAEGFMVRVGPAGPAVGIRAELDALPIHEEGDVPWRSRHDGVAHLCGHDVHMAALFATIRALQSVEQPLPLVAMFQPREETVPSGAEDFVADERVRDEQIMAMLGVHLQPVIPAGAVSAVPGPVNASADDFTVIVRGVPAHGAYPHLSRDPIVTATAIVQALQHLVSRRSNPMNPVVLTVGMISGGESPNQIPGEVSLSGTVRSFYESERLALHDGIRRVATHVAAAYDCDAQVEVTFGDPILTNDEALAESVAKSLLKHGYSTAAPFRSCGADDFAFYGTLFPSLMVFVGVGDGDPASPGLHHPAFAPSDDTVNSVARVMLIAYFAACQKHFESNDYEAPR